MVDCEDYDAFDGVLVDPDRPEHWADIDESDLADLIDGGGVGQAMP